MGKSFWRMELLACAKQQVAELNKGLTVPLYYAQLEKTNMAGLIKGLNWKK